MGWFAPLIKIILLRSTALKFAFGVIVGMAFSMAVILSTVGIMDGFDNALKKGLKKSKGDISVSSLEGFFSWEDNEIAQILAENGVNAVSPAITGQAFLLTKDLSQGVLVQGVSPSLLYDVTSLKLNLAKGNVVIGKELAKEFNLTIGNGIALVHATRDNPVIRRYTISDIVSHGFYQKDLRQVYISLEDMQESLRLENKVNRISFNSPKIDSNWNEIQFFAIELEEALGPEFETTPYWEEYSILFEAVKEQKVIVACMLGLIVIISIFNILAFIIFLGEKYAGEIFIFCALGMSRFRLGLAWPSIIAFLWGASCLLALIFVNLFDWGLRHWSLFQLPEEIYYFGRLELYLKFEHYMLVFFMVLAWLMAISIGIFWRYRRHSLLKGLRREFA